MATKRSYEEISEAPTSSPLVTAAALKEEIPTSAKAAATRALAVNDVRAVLDGHDDRLVVITGPCSIHNIDSAIEFATKLAALKKKFEKDLVVVMRVYFEKPRTTVGWKGLINDPNLDGSYEVNKGLRMARQLLDDVNALGMPAATEFLDLVTPYYLSDLISWGAIGARTTESQSHREMVSGLACPVGFKNGTSGDVQIAVDACGSSSRPHSYLGITPSGSASVLKSQGNPHCHLILRGGSDGPNFASAHVGVACEKMGKGKIRPNVVIDCSHANSLKKHENQPGVASDIAAQMAAGGTGHNIVGVMIEANLVEGAQKVVPGQPLVYGKSITDACVSFETNEAMLAELAAGVQKRRGAPKP